MSVQSKRRDTARKLGFAAVAFAAVMSVSGIAEACLRASVPASTLALSVRTLQSDLMVSALSCNTRASYNAFALEYRPNLKTHGTALKQHFEEVHGGKAKAALNTYVTDLANYAAIRHATDNNAFCGGTERAFRALLIDKTVDFRSLSLAYAMSVSPSLKDEIVLAATTQGCDVVARGTKVVANGVTLFE
jgi:opacity protein-like surface antigen